MRVEGATAIAWRRGRYVPLETQKGPRPQPLDFGPASATAADFARETDFGYDFRCRPRLHVFDDARLIIGSGNDGAILTGGLELVMELSVFTQIGHRPRPCNLEVQEQGEALESIVVGVDGASRNYYHWLVNALARARLCAEFATGGATIVLPDFRRAGDPPGQVRAQVLQASLDAILGERPHRLLAPGAYRVRNLSVLWTRPTSPTDIAGVKRLYEVFDGVAERIAGRPTRRSRRLYISRRGAHDPRIRPADGGQLDRVLARHGFESLTLEDMSFEDQVRAAAEARIIVAPHGAGLTNLLFSHRDAVILELVSHIAGEQSFRPWYYELASNRGQRYGAIRMGADGWLEALDAALRRCLR